METDERYFLEDVEIEGFKSFSLPTQMSFQPGIGVIMGNNGVGKSNILDAIVWALGEDDLGRLRCQEPSELFFSGSGDTPPAARIRVELNFKKGKAKDAPILRLSREKNRSGENRFRIGEDSCSPEEYRRQMEALGLHHTLKTIIRQEQINDIIRFHPVERFRWMETVLDSRWAGNHAGIIGERIDPLFRKYLGILMPQGDGRLQVGSDDTDNGVDIRVSLPGNRARKAHQLSGGEKSIVSLALKLAVFDGLDCPFYLLDEVEPALDYINHKAMQAFLKSVAEKRQLIMITHLRSTIELADTLHGVRTRMDGSSFMKFYFVMDARLLRLYKCC